MFHSHVIVLSLPPPFLLSLKINFRKYFFKKILNNLHTFTHLLFYQAYAVSSINRQLARAHKVARIKHKKSMSRIHRFIVSLCLYKVQNYSRSKSLSSYTGQSVIILHKRIPYFCWSFCFKWIVGITPVN